MPNLVELAEITPIQVWEGVVARRVEGERLTVAVVELAPNAEVPEHRHPHEQCGLVIEGEALMRIGDEERGTAWCEAHYGSDGAGFFEVLQEIAPADQAAFDDEAFTASLTASIREAFRQGVAAYAQDIVVQGRPWALDLQAIVAPVLIHHGDADTMTPSAHSRRTAELIPGARLTIWPDEGHISLITKIPEIASELVAAAH